MRCVVSRQGSDFFCIFCSGFDFVLWFLDSDASFWFEGLVLDVRPAASLCNHVYVWCALSSTCGSKKRKRANNSRGQKWRIELSSYFEHILGTPKLLWWKSQETFFFEKENGDSGSPVFIWFFSLCYFVQISFHFLVYSYLVRFCTTMHILMAL